MKRIASLFCVLIFCFSAGTGCRNNDDTVSALAESGNLELSDTAYQKEDFDRSIALLNSLEDLPCIPNSQGYETIINTADRLDKWIQHRKGDETWKPENLFAEVEKTARTASESVKNAVNLLHLLRGETADGQHSPLFRDERKQLSETLTRFVSELQTLSKLAELPQLNSYSQLVEALKKKFEALEQIPNINEDGVRSFTKQLNSETSEFNSIANMFDNFAELLKTDGLSINTADVEYIKQALWLRNISNWARGSKQSLLSRIANLFDWTVCNVEWRNKYISLNENQDVDIPPQYPWQTVLLGYGTIFDRAAVFIELLRQQRIDAALLAMPNPADATKPVFWAVGVLIDDEVYVYLLTHGFPLPGPGGVKIGEDGALDFSETATLSQCLKEDSLLRKVDLSKGNQFPVTAELLKNSTAYLFITPQSTSMRMKVLESELTGDQMMVLYSDAQELHRRFSAAKGITKVEVWKYPLQTNFEQVFRHNITESLMAPFLLPNIKDKNYPLWSGRILYFKGHIAGQDSAMTKWQDVRIPDRELIEYRKEPEFRNNPALEAQIQLVTADAAYYLGLASFENNSVSAAKDFLESLNAGNINLWRDNTEYLLGRIAEREKRYSDAKACYERTVDSLSGMGNLVRSNWLPK